MEITIAVKEKCSAQNATDSMSRSITDGRRASRCAAQGEQRQNINIQRKNWFLYNQAKRYSKCSTNRMFRPARKNGKRIVALSYRFEIYLCTTIAIFSHLTLTRNRLPFCASFQVWSVAAAPYSHHFVFFFLVVFLPFPLCHLLFCAPSNPAYSFSLCVAVVP